MAFLTSLKKAQKKMSGVDSYILAEKSLLRLSCGTLEIPGKEVNTRMWEGVCK